MVDAGCEWTLNMLISVLNDMGRLSVPGFVHVLMAKFLESPSCTVGLLCPKPGRRINIKTAVGYRDYNYKDNNVMVVTSVLFL